MKLCIDPTKPKYPVNLWIPDAGIVLIRGTQARLNNYIDDADIFLGSAPGSTNSLIILIHNLFTNAKAQPDSLTLAHKAYNIAVADNYAQQIGYK